VPRAFFKKRTFPVTKRTKMKSFILRLLVSLAVATAAITALAQEPAACQPTITQP
jgi:hypothetical protein